MQFLSLYFHGTHSILIALSDRNLPVINKNCCNTHPSRLLTKDSRLILSRLLRHLLRLLQVFAIGVQVAVVVHFGGQRQVDEHGEVVRAVVAQPLHSHQPKVLRAKQVVEREA